jgi:hypothetical protein
MDDDQERRRKELRAQLAMLRIDSAAMMERVEKDLRELKMLELRRKIEQRLALNRTRARAGLPPLADPEHARKVKARALQVLKKGRR